MEQWLLAICAAAFVSSLVYCLLNSRLGERAVAAQRLRRVREMYHREDENRHLDEKKNFTERMLIPVSQEIIQRVAVVLPLNDQARKRLEKQLVMAGSRMRAREYAAATIIIIVCMAFLGYYVAPLLGDKLPPLLGMVLGAYGAYTIRRFSLNRAISTRKEKIEDQLPNIIDLLSVSVTAGLGFEQALGYVAERCEGEFVDEIRLLQQQLSMGRARKEAMKALAERCEIDEVSTFVSSVLQADAVGISMQTILNSQAAAIRKAHKQKVEEKAAKLPIKILLPIILFIFPVLFIILLGPAVPSLLDALGGL